MMYGESYSTEELQELLIKMRHIIEQCEEIQKKFEFTIPNYVLEEIVFTKNKMEKCNLHLMINIAFLNNKLTKRQAQKLKKYYC